MISGYKIVTPIYTKKGGRYNHYVSLFFAHFPCAKVVYSLNEPARPLVGCGPLGVFIDFDLAKKFNDLYLGILFSCYFIQSKEEYQWCDCTKKNKDYPKGTILADEVTILEKIKLG